MKSLRIPLEQAEKISTKLEEAGLKFREVENTLWSYEGNGVFFNLYNSGVLLIQGKNCATWVEKVLSWVKSPENPIAGCDEVGKGDIFGPLVLCCAVILPEKFKDVLKVVPRDSKTMKDSEIKAKAEQLRELVHAKFINLLPDRFNELYKKYGNINRLMDSGYKRLISEIKDLKPEYIMIDKYSATDPFLEDPLVRFVEKGEKYVPVSVASILARSRFLYTLSKLGEIYGLDIPKGASSNVKKFASELIEEKPDIAKKLIKISFLK